VGGQVWDVVTNQHWPIAADLPNTTSAEEAEERLCRAKTHRSFQTTATFNRLNRLNRWVVDQLSIRI
jgi:hypothetical protein